MGNAKLTTSSPASDFRWNLSTQYSTMQAYTMKLTQIHTHESKSNPMRGWGHRSGSPDEVAFHTGFSMLLSALQGIVERMEEAEDALASLQDDSEDEAEILHAAGELFAAKSIYLSLVDGIEPLEHSRIEATRAGVTASEYFHRLSKAGRVPDYTDDPTHGFLTARNLSANSVVQGKISQANITFKGMPTIPTI